MAPQLIPELIKFFSIVGSTGTKSQSEVLLSEGGCLASLRPTFYELFIKMMETASSQT